MPTSTNNQQKGFTIIEILMVLVIVTVMTTIIISVFSSFAKKQALEKDTDLVVETLREARNLTLSARDAYQYGVHIGSTTVTLFIGPTYLAATATNKVFGLNPRVSVTSLTLSGGGNDVLFSRLTGETSQSGTIILSSSPYTSTTTLYKTGIIESH